MIWRPGRLSRLTAATSQIWTSPVLRPAAKYVPRGVQRSEHSVACGPTSCSTCTCKHAMCCSQGQQLEALLRAWIDMAHSVVVLPAPAPWVRWWRSCLQGAAMPKVDFRPQAHCQHVLLAPVQQIVVEVVCKAWRI